MIPYLDLKRINSKFEVGFQKRFANFLESGYYVLGQQVKAFENAYAEFCGSKFCIGTASGLDALTLILKGYVVLNKLKEEDEIIVASNTFIATIMSVKTAGLTPVLVEPDIETYNLDATLVSKHITPKTKAIVVTHLYGQLADTKALFRIASEHNLLLIDDSAQSHGAKNIDGKRSGNLCDASAHSFYPTKNLGALGDAGAVTTNDSDLAEVLSKLRNYGFSERNITQYEGMNSRLDEVQATFLLEKLPSLDADNAKRQAVAKRYLDGIQNSKVILPKYDGSQNHVFHVFAVRVKNKEALEHHLTKNGIGYNIHYPKAPHHQETLSEYKNLNLPITEKIHEEILSLPCHPELTSTEIDKIITVINAF